MSDPKVVNEEKDEQEVIVIADAPPGYKDAVEAAAAIVDRNGQPRLVVSIVRCKDDPKLRIRLRRENAPIWMEMKWQSDNDAYFAVSVLPDNGSAERLRAVREHNRIVELFNNTCTLKQATQITVMAWALASL